MEESEPKNGEHAQSQQHTRGGACLGSGLSTPASAQHAGATALNARCLLLGHHAGATVLNAVGVYLEGAS
eukprot:1136809-Pelagomonas_calceolata.AAC.4